MSLGRSLREIRLAKCFQFGQCVLLDSLALISKTLLIQHVVGLVQNKNLDTTAVQQLPPDHVHDGTGRTNNDLALKFLIAPAGIGNGSGDHKAFHVLAHLLNHTHDLTCQFATGRKDKGLRGDGRQVHAAQHVEGKGRSLASARLRLADKICGRVYEEKRESLLLDLGRLLEAHAIEALEDLRLPNRNMNQLVSLNLYGLGNAWDVQLQVLESLCGEERVVRVGLKIGKLDLDIVLGLVEAAAAGRGGCAISLSFGDLGGGLIAGDAALEGGSGVRHGGQW